MTGLFDNLLLGFAVALTPANVAYCFLGAALGTLIGVLPGVGPISTIAMLLPATFALPPVSALIMLAGIYYGAQYGGSTTAILVNLPGESSSVVTCLDGHAMARQGRAGPALAIAALGSFLAGCVGTLLIALFGPPLADLALGFGPADYTSLMVLGLVSAVALARGSQLRAVGMVLLGLILGLVGADVNSGLHRFTFGRPELADGIDFVVLALGLFGVAEIVTSLEAPEARRLSTTRVHGLWPTRDDLRASLAPVLRGTALGSVLGLIPGSGPLVASFAAYTVEKRLAREPERFGRGAIEGVAGPEAANNASAQTTFIPMLTLGIPGTATMALMLGALMIHGITPGPQVMTEHPRLFWGLVTSMWLGNVMLVLLNLPLIGVWVRLLTVPYRLLYPAILLFACIGVYSLSNSPADLVLTALFGVLGYVFVKLDCEPAPLLLGFILGRLMEVNVRRALLLSRGDPTVFITRPVSLALLLLTALVLLAVLIPARHHRWQPAAPE